MLQIPHQHCTNFPNIALENSRANFEQKDKIVQNTMERRYCLKSIKAICILILPLR